MRLPSPVTLSLEVHWEEVSELSVAVATQGQRHINAVRLDQALFRAKRSSISAQTVCTGVLLKLLCA